MAEVSGFLEVVLQYFGFPELWIRIITECVASASYLGLINRIPSTAFRPGAGIRWGDPLSPYLFILCMKVLSDMLI